MCIEAHLKAEVVNLVGPAGKTLPFPLQTAAMSFGRTWTGSLDRRAGRSSDVSEFGVFVFVPVCLRVGASVVLTIDLDGVAALFPV
jgi:hypothetical protein